MSRPALPVIEAWRGLAAVMVLLSHFGPPAGIEGWAVRFAFTGVDLFFVLSGFVFAPHLLGQREPVLPFAIRRAFRILPAYYLALGSYTWIALHEGRPAPLLEHIFMLHLQSSEMAFSLNPAFWSLVPEVEFYILLPLIAWLGGSWRLGLLFGLALCVRIWLGYSMTRQEPSLSYILLHHLPGMLVEFLLGSAAWALSQRKISKPMRALLALLGLALWLAAAYWFWWVGGDPGADLTALKGQPGLVAAFAFACVVAGTAQFQFKGAALRLALGAGSLSYGLYLWHHGAWWLVHHGAGSPSLATAFAAFCLCLVLAWLSYYAIERPMRLLGRRLAHSAK